MIIDTSAVCAILFGEPDARRYEEAMTDADVCRISAGTLLETAIVVEARIGADGGRDLDALIEQRGIEIVPVTAEQVSVARRAWRRFGRGNNPASSLNLGDCFSYALAALAGEPLLYKGEDFTHTDVAGVS